MVFNKTKHLFFLIFAVAFLGISPSLQAQKEEKPPKRNSFSGIPLVFNTPETSWGFGAAAVYAFRMKNEPDTAKASQMQLGFAYTLKKQVLFYLPYNLYFQQKNYSVYGELGYYRYFFSYFGTGNIEEDYEEVFGVTLPRFRLNALRKVRANTYVGIRYWFDDFQITEVDSTGRLAQNLAIGSEGGIISSLGIVANYDTRDNNFWPSGGEFIELVLTQNSKLLGSDFEYTRFSIDATKYFNIIKNQVLAINYYGDFTSGEVPFNEAPRIGGTRKMRGYFEGRFRDNNLMMLQAEYRIPLFWRVGMVVFGGYGGVADKFNNFKLDNFKWAGGGGIRFALNKKEKINLRLDVGYGEDLKFYLTATEAF